MKQTLFEAEAILSANTAGMLADIDAAVAAAKRKMQSLNGSWSVAGASGGFGGGGSGNRGNNTRNDLYRQQMQLIAIARAEGDYANAIARANLLLRNRSLTSQQLLRVEKTLVDTRNQANRAQQSYDLKSQKAEAQTGSKAAAALKTQINETKQLINAEVRAAMSVGEFNRAVQIQSQYLGTLKKDTTEYYNALAKLNHLKNIGAQAGDPMARQRNAMVQNLSFGAQDFAVVMSMGGGLGRAMAAASNNLAFMTSMMGTVKGAVAGLGITLAAVLTPTIYKAVMGFEDLGEGAKRAEQRIKDLSAAIKDMSRRYEDAIKFREMADPLMGGSLDDMYEERRQLLQDKDRATAAYDVAVEGASSVRGGAVNDFFKTMGTIVGDSWKDMPSWQEWQQKITTGDISSTDIREQASHVNPLEEAMFGTKTSLLALADAIDAANDPSKDAAAAIEELNEKLHQLDQFARERAAYDAEANRAMGQRNFGPTNSSQDWVAQGQQVNRDWDREQEKKKRLAPMQLSAVEGLFDQFFPKEAAKRKIDQQYAEARYGVTDPTTLSQLSAMQAFQRAEVDKQGREKIVGTMGGSEFASQLTNQLLKADPQERLHQEAVKQSGLQQELVLKMDALIEVNKTDVTTPFANN